MLPFIVHEAVYRQAGTSFKIERPSFSTPGKEIEPKIRFKSRDPLSDKEKTRSLSYIASVKSVIKIR